MGTSLVIQWLILCALSAGGMGLISGQGTKITCMLHGPGQKKKKKRLSSISQGDKIKRNNTLKIINT